MESVSLYRTRVLIGSIMSLMCRRAQEVVKAVRNALPPCEMAWPPTHGRASAATKSVSNKRFSLTTWKSLISCVGCVGCWRGRKVCWRSSKWWKWRLTSVVIYPRRNLTWTLPGNVSLGSWNSVWHPTSVIVQIALRVMWDTALILPIPWFLL